MANQKQVSLMVATGSMNQDDSILSPPEGKSAFEAGDYRYARNVRIGSSSEDNTGGVENLPSTLLINNYYVWNGSAWVLGSQPSGTSTPINKFEDHQNNIIYWFCYHASEPTILFFNKSERKIYELLRWSGLNFSTDSLVSACKINNYLIITDYRNPPRIFDVTLIYSLKLTLGSAFSEYHVSFAKWAPLPAPLVRRNLVGTSDFVRKGIYQFSYRYIYRGGFKSTFAPPSWFVTNEITDQNYTFNVCIPGDILNVNDPSTPIFHGSAAFYTFVEFIEITYRESTKDPWKLFKRHTVTSGNNTFHDFENNGPLATIPQSESGQYFDSVPFKSGACEAIDNRPMFADNDDEILVEPLVITDVAVYSARAIDDNWNGPQAAFSSLSGPQQIELGRILNSRQFSFLEGGLYKCAILYQHNTGRTGLAQTTQNWSYLIPSNTGYQIGGYVYSLGFKIDASITPPATATAYQILRTNCLNIEMALFGTVNDFTYLGLSTAPNTENVQTPQAVVDILNDYFNSNDNNISDGFNISERLANYYRQETVVTTMNQCSRIAINIKNWTQVNNAASLGTTMNPSNNVFYNWRKGDRVKILGSTTTSIQQGDLQIFDVEIADYNGTNIFINKPPGLVLLPQRATTPNSDLFFEIEIYRPKKFSEGDTVLFYEMGEWYPITNPTTPSRDFIKRDFTWGGASAVTQTSFGDHVIYQRMPLVNGDIWVVNKTMYYDWFSGAFPGVSVRIKFMQMNQDKFNAGGFWEHNTGKPYPGYSYLPTQINKPSQIRFGGKFLQDSIFNSINTFKADNEFLYPAEYGRIRALVNTSNAQVESVGNIMLAIGEREAWSIYVNRTTLEDLAGRSQVSISDKVLGSFNTLLGSMGTLNPESVSKQNGRVIWYCNAKGGWVRYSRDGLTNVSSEFKMKNWFRDISDLIARQYTGTSNPRAISTYDNYHEEWITRIDHSTLPSTFKGYDSYKCISFSEVNTKRGWKSVLDYTPTLFATLDLDVYSIVGCTIQIHETGTDYGKIYGNEVIPQLQLVSAISPLETKDFRNITLYTSDEWSIAMEADWKSNNATKQASRILIDNLALKEGVYWSDIKKDQNSPNAASTTIAIVNGNPIKTRGMKFLLTMKPGIDYLSVLYQLGATYDSSEKNL
jgi:hypothetical protein